MEHKKIKLHIPPYCAKKTQKTILVMNFNWQLKMLDYNERGVQKIELATTSESVSYSWRYCSGSYCGTPIDQELL